MMSRQEQEAPQPPIPEAKTLATNPDFKNGVMAVDPTTIAVAFRKFSDHIDESLDEFELTPTPEGEELFEGLAGYSDSDFDVHDVVADAGGELDRKRMNDLAAEHGFPGPFTEEFEPDEIGVLSIVDKKMKWHAGDAYKATVDLRDGEKQQKVEGVVFNLDKDLGNDEHFAIFDVKGFSKPVVRIAADPEKSDGVQNYMWVTEISPEENPSLIELFRGVKNTVDVITQSGTNVKKRGAAEVASVTMPKLSKVEYKRDWEEINGTVLGNWEVKQAKQAVRVTIDEIGAEAAAMFSKVPVFRGATIDPPREHIVIGDTGPMLVWFTEGESRLPICATITNQEAWQAVER